MLTIKEKLLPIAVVLTFGVVLSACDNTIRGIGEDTKETVEAVSDSVEGKPNDNAE